MAQTKRQVYEQERQAQNEWAKRDFESEKMLEEVYQASIRQMQQKIDDYYLSYSNRTGLTRAEANKKIKSFNVSQWADKAAKAVKEKDFSPYTNEWLKTYNTKMYISRVELLKAELELELQSMYAQENAIINKHGMNEAIAEWRRQAGILGGSSTGSVKRVKSIVNADFYGSNFSELIWGRNGHYQDVRKQLFASLNRMYTDMDGYRTERNNLMKMFDTTEYEAMRLLRTETSRIRADSALASMEENGATHYIWRAEAGACSDCAPLNGTAIPVEEAEKGVTMFPVHPNCRCSVHGHIEMKYKDGRSTLDEYEQYEG